MSKDNNPAAQPHPPPKSFGSAALRGPAAVTSGKCQAPDELLIEQARFPDAGGF